MKTYRAEYLPDGLYSATITAAEEKSVEGKLLIRIAAAVAPENADFAGAVASGLVPYVLAGRSRLATWYSQTTGKSLSDGEEVDLNDMVGKRIRMTVENHEGKDGKSYPRIEKIEAGE